jgi:hypothetical protein
MKRTTETFAWLSDTSLDSIENLYMLSPVDLANKVTFYSNENFGGMGYSKIGVATITIELLEQSEMFENKLEALKRDLVTVKAAAQAKVQEIEEKIQNLMAISYSGDAK